MRKASILLLLMTCSVSLQGQSIAQKKANLKMSESGLDHETERHLIRVNQDVLEMKSQIQDLYSQVLALHAEDAAPDDYQSLLREINAQKRRLYDTQTQWHGLATKMQHKEGYGLWHAPATTLEQLIIDYGSQDYVYLIPPDVSTIKLSINSNLPIPRSSWGEMLEMILTQNGVGIRTLNPYLKELYLIKNDNSSLMHITNDRCELEILPPDGRICFVLSPEPSEVRRTYNFLERFVHPQSTVLQLIGRDILIIGPSGSIQELLKLSDFVAANRGQKEFRLIPVTKVEPDAMAAILASVFDNREEGPSTPLPPPPSFQRGKENKGARPSAPAPDFNGLKIIVLQGEARALFVSGTLEEVNKAEEVIINVEAQIGGARDKVVHWYTVRHSDAEELADVLYRVYSLMAATGTGFDGGPGSVDGSPEQASKQSAFPPLPPRETSPLYGDELFYKEGDHIVNPTPAEPGTFLPTQPNKGRDNFIVDIKTGSIVMVVDADLLPKMKELTKKLDVPKKMVQIETVLFEKVLSKENQFGMNLLRIGEHIASNCHATGAIFNTVLPHGQHEHHTGKGVFEFLLSRKTTNSGIPAFDMIYRFLLSQEDVQINSNPSVTTVNQTPATITINEEISINTGVYEYESNSNINAFKDAFTRAQYGINISVKPTIHLAQEDDPEGCDSVSLETDITFDTISVCGNKQRPDVTRRQVKNQVLIPDGETVVIGGLRHKVTRDSREAIPFLGELPGLGKLFSTNTLRDNTTEMFIFITPRIVKDPKDQLRCLRQELLCLRPGDVPYFLQCVQEAYEYEKSRLLQGSMTILLGRPKDRYYITDDYCEEEGEYDGC